MLKELGFEPYMKPAYKGKRDKNPVYNVMLQRRDDVRRFIEEIGFDSTKHLTKWKIYYLSGSCPPHTTIKERYEILENLLKEGLN